MKKNKYILTRRNFLQLAGTGALVTGTQIYETGIGLASPNHLPVVGDYDVIVCGGGTSGLPAAIAAARLGAKVAIIERYGFLGGNPAFSIMPTWHKIKIHHSGLLTEFMDRVAQFGMGPNPWENENIEPEALKMIFLNLALENKIDLYLHTFIVGVMKHEQGITGIITESKSGGRVFKAKVVVDATGDGDVNHLAGGSYVKGDNGKMQGMTLRFRIGYIDIQKYLDWAIDHLEYFRKAKKEKINLLKKREKEGLAIQLGTNMSEIWENDPDPDLPRNTYFTWASIRPNEFSINSTRIYDVDGTDANDLTKAEIVTRKQVQAIWRYLKKNIPGFENSMITETAPQVGVRETRLTTGDYVLTKEDAYAQKEFEDSVMTCRVKWDSHDRHKYETFGIKDAMVDVPYRCLLPRNLEGILVVGRTVSTDHLTNSAIRQMQSSFQSGQIGGTAAALAVKDGKTPRELSIRTLQEQLAQDGMMISQTHRIKNGRHLRQLEYNKYGIMK